MAGQPNGPALAKFFKLNLQEEYVYFNRLVV